MEEPSFSLLKHIRKRFYGDRAKESEAVHFPFNARLKCEITSAGDGENQGKDQKFTFFH